MFRPPKRMRVFQHEPDMKLYHQFKVLDKQLDNMSKMWLKAQSPEEASLVGTALRDYRAGMVKVLEADGEEAQKEATADLSRIMSEFYAKYQEMQPQRM